VHFDNWYAIDSRLQPSGAAIARPVGTAYAAHLRERAQDIRRMLETL
jgi:hypothetical protein